MTINIEIEQTTFPGDMGNKADFAVKIEVAGATFEFDVHDRVDFKSKSAFEIFESLRECDPQALRAIADNYSDDQQIIFNSEVMKDGELQDILDVCETTQTLEI
jgi:hypothetical protein